MGTFVVSLDFELYWGVRHIVSLEDYRDNLLGVRQVVPLLLSIFAEYGIHATWATVGFLFFETKEELLAALPTEWPQYADERLNPYRVLDDLGNDEDADPFHFAGTLVRQIARADGQELATHTFSHYY